MPVERYLAELTLTFDVSDDLLIHRKVEYETYASFIEKLNMRPMPQTLKMPKKRLGCGFMIFVRNSPKILRTM